MEKYLVRPSDYMVWELREDLGLYEIMDPPTDRFGNKPIPYDHFTFENLTAHGFFPITEDELGLYAKLRENHYQALSEQLRANNGHGDDDDSC
jgi:hypothetical protein